MAVTQNLTIVIGAQFGPGALTVYSAAGAVVPLAGYEAFAQIRAFPDGPVLLDLAPTIAPDDADGLVTIPAVPAEITAELSEGKASWDMLLRAPSGAITPPVQSGTVTLIRTITRVP